MSIGKLSVTVGGITFRGEGDQAWLSQQLEKVLAAAASFPSPEPASRVATPANGATSPVAVFGDSAVVDGSPLVGSTPSGSPVAASAAGGASGEKFTTGLASYIKEKGGDASQVDRFLIVADWLRLRGESRLTTALVSKTLVDNHQKRLANPSDCLSKNLSKGLCEKTDNGFYITPEGLKRLGHG